MRRDDCITTISINLNPIEKASERAMKSESESSGTQCVDDLFEDNKLEEPIRR